MEGTIEKASLVMKTPLFKGKPKCTKAKQSPKENYNLATKQPTNQESRVMATKLEKHVDTWLSAAFCISRIPLVKRTYTAMAPKTKAKAMKKAPVKAMKKTPMKASKSKAAPLLKGKGNNSKKAPLVKGKTPMKVMKLSLKRKNLKKLGKMTLAEKIKKAGEDADTAEEAASNLRGMLDKQEHSRVWSKYQTALKSKSQEEQKEFQEKNKNDKGFDAALHLVKSEVPKFFHYQASVDHTNSLDKRERWLSEKKMREIHGDDFEAHLESGRIVWRADPWSANVWNYCDKGDMEKKTSVRKRQQWTEGQEYQPSEEDQQHWEQFYQRDLLSHMSALGKGGGGKGKQSSLVKGKGKGKNRRGQQQLALEDGEVEGKEEKEEWKEVLSKAKKARDQASQARDDCEAALKKADLAKRLTKESKKDTEGLLAMLARKVQTVKDLLAQKDEKMTLEKAKKILLDTMTKVKEVKDETKELNQLASKAGSKASKGSKR